MIKSRIRHYGAVILFVILMLALYLPYKLYVVGMAQEAWEDQKIEGSTEGAAK